MGDNIIHLNPNKTISSDDNKVCVICIEPICPNELTCELKCSHRYHSFCIQPWKRVQNRCPQCRLVIECNNHSEHPDAVWCRVVEHQDSTITKLQSQNQELQDGLLAMTLRYAEISQMFENQAAGIELFHLLRLPF